jgi:hypothetical protein
MPISRSVSAPIALKAAVRYEIITNRPLSPGLIDAFQALRNGRNLEGDAADQAKYIKDALPDLAAKLTSFLSRISLQGFQGTLADAQGAVSLRGKAHRHHSTVIFGPHVVLDERRSGE